MKREGPGKTDRRERDVLLFLGAAIVKAGDGDWERVGACARLAASTARQLVRKAARRKAAV
jgi:hypothetical protein